MVYYTTSLGYFVLQPCLNQGRVVGVAHRQTAKKQELWTSWQLSPSKGLQLLNLRNRWLRSSSITAPSTPSIPETSECHIASLGRCCLAAQGFGRLHLKLQKFTGGIKPTGKGKSTGELVFGFLNTAFFLPLVRIYWQKKYSKTKFNKNWFESFNEFMKNTPNWHFCSCNRFAPSLFPNHLDNRAFPLELFCDLCENSDRFAEFVSKRLLKAY